MSGRSRSPTGRTRTRPRCTASRRSPSRRCAGWFMSGGGSGERSGRRGSCCWSSTWPGISIGNHLLALLAGPAVVAFLVATLRHEPGGGSGPAARGVGPGGGGGGGMGAAHRHRARQHRADRGRRRCAFSPPRCSPPPAAGGAFALAEPRHRRGRRSPRTSTSTSARRRTRSSTRPRRPPSTRCSPSSAGPSIRRARRSTIRRWPTARTIPGRTLAILGAPARSTTSSTSTGSGPSPSVPGLQVPRSRVGVPRPRAARVAGAAARRPPAWWLLLVLFLVTGLGLVVYMNFKPGFSLATIATPRRRITKSGSGTTSSS